MNRRTVVAALAVLSSFFEPFAVPAARAESPVAESLGVDHAPLQGSWREVVSRSPALSARAHVQPGVTHGPALFRLAAPNAALRVTLDGMPITDPFTGQATFELPLDALRRLALHDDGSLSLETRRGRDGEPRVVSSVSSEALSPALGSLTSGRRERYELTLAGSRAVARGTLGLLATGQARTFGDREPRRVDHPYPGDAASQFGAAPYTDGRLPGNGLTGASGYARLGWASAGDSWRVALSGAESHDDWREYVHAYLFDAAHMPRNLSQWVGGSLALEYRGPVEIAFRASRTGSSLDRGDGALLGGEFDGGFGNWARASVGDPVYDVNVPLFWSAGHVYGRFERSRALFTEYSGEATWRVSVARTMRLTALARQWELRHFSVSSSLLFFDENGFLAGSDFTGYGYDGFARENDTGLRRPRRQSLELNDDWRGAGPLRAGYAIGFVRADRPKLRTILDGYGQLHDIADGTHSSLDLTFAAHAGQEFASGRTWRVNVARTVEEFPGLALAEESSGESPGVLWESSLALAGPLAAGWNGAVRVTVRQRDEPDGSVAVPLGLYSPPQDDSENFRALDARLSRVVPGRFEGRLSAVWARSEYRVTGGRRSDVSWGGGSPTDDVPTLDDRAVQLSAGATAWLGGTPESRAWRFDALARAESGAPYTPYQPYNEVTLSAVAGIPAGELHSRRLPWAATLDAAATRVLRAGGIEWEATAALYNVLDRRNAAEVYAGTGRPDDTGWLATEEGRYWLSTTGEQGRSMYELAQHDPTHWQRPRTFTLALRAAF